MHKDLEEASIDKTSWALYWLGLKIFFSLIAHLFSERQTVKDFTMNKLVCLCVAAVVWNCRKILFFIWTFYIMFDLDLAYAKFSFKLRKQLLYLV